jgi:uncharacterized repeat protein (TIGR02543 family)
MWGLSSTVTIGSTNYPTAQTGTTVSGTGDLSSTWYIAVVANYFAGNDNGSIHAGSNNKTATSITLTSSSFSGKTITAVSVTGRDANGTESNRAVFTAKVNGSVFGSTSRFSSTSTPYTATGNVVCTGNVSVEVVRPSAQTKAIYVSAVSVTFNNGGTTYTVTYNLNGGTGTTPTEAAKAKDATFSLHNGTTGITAPSGKIFSQWKDQDNLYFNGGATYTMPAKNVTLTAQWVNAYTVTYNLNGGTGTTPTESKKAASATFTLHDGTTGITAPAGKGFSKWKDQDGNEYDASDTYTMPAKNVTLTAQWIDLPSYSLVTSVNQFYDGAKIIITNEDMDRALSTNQRTANREAVAVTCTNNIITPGNTVQIITLEESGDNWKFKVGTDSYLYASSSSSNELKTDNATTSGDNGVWSISIASDVATVVAQGTNSRNNMRYNPNNNNPNLFACYASSSANGKVKLFIEPATKATLTFDLNDKTLSSGSVPDDITNVTLNEAYTLPTTTLGATGYTFVGWNNDKNANSKLTTFTPTEATTYTLYAIWSANTNTEYKVKHYKQNLDGTYPASPTETDNLTGTTDASVTPARKSYTGFTAPSGTPSTILADGSLVVTYNYTRNSYALTWSTDGDALTGDYTGKSGNVKYEAPITAPNTPTKMGYTFSAWSPTPASTMPAVATTYTATWTCKIPNIAVDPVSAVYALNDEATPLSVTVEGAGAWCGYQWQSSSDNSNWSNIAAGDGGTSATYTPSTASAGSTTYYRVIVRNITDDCSTFSTSEAALVEVSSLPVCATPTFTPSASVAYNSNQTITISCETADVTIYYTVGATPADPTTESTQYDPDHKPVISASATIKAIAVKDSYTTSAVGSATYEFKCVAPTFSPAAGDVATGQEITLNCETAGTTIYYTMGTNPADPTTASTQYDPEDKPVVSEATTIKAIAVKDGWSNSTVASAAYAMIYTVTLNAGTGSVSAEGWTESAGVWTKTQASAGSSIPLPDAALSSSLTTAGWSFAGWKTTSAETTQTETKPDFVNKTYTPTSDITLYAVYQKTTGAANYELVEEDLDDAWAGDYLIAYSSSIFADGRIGGKDDEGSIGRQSTHVSPGDNLSANGKVVTGSWGNTYNVTLEEISENSNTYVLKTKDGKYNYQSSNANGLAVSANKETAAAYPISVTFNSSSDISLALGGDASGAIFHYNTSSLGSGGDVFRYYKNGGQAAIYLYKKGEGAKSYYSNPSDQVTLTYDANGATAGEAPTVPGTITIGTNVTVVAKPNDLVKTGHDFGGWNTKDDGTGTNYEAGTDHESFTINDNTTLYAKWTKKNYTVAVASVDHTAITATPEGSSAITESANASVAYGTVVTLGKTNDTHFTFDEWDVYETNNSSNKVTVTETAGVYTFTVPDFNVTVSATAPIEDHKNTVIWHVNYETSETANVYDGTPFSQLSAPAVADNAVSTCANKFMGWATAAVSKDNATSSDVEWADATNVSSTNKDFYAVWATGSGSESETTFTRITNAADFVEGQKIIIVSNANAHMLGNDFTGGDEPTETNGEITVSDNKYVWTIGEIDNNGWFQLSSGDVYLSTAAGVTSSAKYQAVTNNTNEYSWWSIDDQLSTTNCFALLNDGGSTDSDEDWEWISYLEWYNSNSQWQSYYVTNFGTETYFALRFYKPKTITNYSNYITNCCLPVENTLTITNANQVATGNTLTLSSTGGNGGTVVWTVEAGTGTATISEGVLTGGNLGTVTLKAHQNEYNNYCAQDAEDMTVEIVAATVPVTSVSLNHTTAALLPGETIQLNATLTPGNATDQTIGWVSGTPAKATVSNAGLVTAVAKGTSTVTATANGGDNVTATCAVTVHGLTILKQDETGATISVEGVTASATGKALTASAGETQYVFKGWKYAENGNGGLDAIANASNTSITLTGTPTGDVTIIAEFYKPVTITWLVDGEDAASGSQTLSVARGTLWSALTPAAEPAGNALGSCATAFVGWSNSMNDELRGNGNPAPAVLFRNAQISSYDTEITDPITFRAVFATSAAGSTFDGEHGGTYKIYALIGETKYYANGTGSKINNTTDVSLATNYTIEVVTGGFAIKTGDNYITYSSSTNLGTSTDPYTWTVASGTKGTWRLNSGTSGRGWIYRAGTTNQFGGYATNNVTAAGTEYYDLEIGNDASYSNYVTVCCTPHAITVTGNDDSENKTVSADATEICDGMTVNLSRSTSCTHYTFNEWVVKYTDGESVDHTINVPEATASFTMPAYDVTVEGDWSPVNYKVTIASAANGTATVKEGYATDENGKWIVPYGETVTLQAAPNDAEAYYFSGWTLSPDKDVQKSQAELPITMTGSFTATPSFAPVVYSALTLDGTEGVYSLSATLANGDPIPNMSSIKSGTALKVTYALSGQNEYVGWTFSVNSVEKTAEGTTVTFNMPEEALNVSLNTRPYYMLNLSAEHGSITGVSINSEAQALAAQYIVHEGEVVALTAAPADDTYKFKEWTGATVSNGQFTVGTEDLDVVAVFELKTTYTLTLMALGSEQEKIEGILEGESIWEQIEDKEAPEITGQLFLGWSLLEDDKDMIISESEDLDIDDNYPLYAVYQAMTPCYVKVTSTSDIKNGKYLIVYETGGLAFNGGLETLDATSNTIGVEINTTGDYKTIAISENTTAAEFTIASLDGGGYSIKSASGKYIDRTSGTSGGGFNTTESNPKAHTLSIDNDGNFADKASASTASYLKYNSSSGQYRFRYYTSGQQAIQLYKRAGIPNDAGETASIPTVTITTPVNADEIYPDGKAGNIVVEAGGKLNVSDNLNVNNIFIESEACASGQVIGATNLHGDLYMDVTFFKGATTLNETTAGRWYMISAPFDVNLNDGFTLTDGTAMHFGVDDNALTFDLFEYDGTKRATTGVTGWKRVQGKMKAGTACLIGFNPGQPTTIRLKAASTTLTEKTSITLQAFDGDATNQNWNGVANPTLHYTNIDQNVQVYENEDGEHGRKYNVYSASTYSFVVGTAFFVQATGSIGLEAASHSQFRAPKRESERYEACVQIFRQEATEFADQMYVRASETASNEYEQGHDMITWNGTTGNTAMIWAENYGKRLAIEEAPLVSNQASYVLGIFAPKAGTYRIAATSEDDADLYLTYEGAIIWNLSMGAYEIELNKGTTDGYGLLLQKKAPQTPTGVDEVDAKTGVQKIIINDNVFILRGGQMYDVTGKAVK